MDIGGIHEINMESKLVTYKTDKSRVNGMFDGTNRSFINRRRCRVQVRMNVHETFRLTALSSLNQPRLKSPGIVLLCPSLCSIQEMQTKPVTTQRANWLATAVDMCIFLDGTRSVSLVLSIFHLCSPRSNLNSVPCSSSVGLESRCWPERTYACFLIPNSRPVILPLAWALAQVC